MKNLILPVIAFLLFHISHAQPQGDWSEPVVLTDSLSSNSNPNILIMGSGGGSEVFMFYEKKWNNGYPKEIWMRNITEFTDEQMVLAADVIEFRNPQLLKTNYSSPKYYLIFESGLNDNFDIFGIEFFEDGSFGIPFQLTNTPENEQACYINFNFEYNKFTASWEANGNILVAEIIENSDTLKFIDVEIIELDSGMEPVCSSQHVYWRKMMNDSSGIYFSEELPAGWSDPQPLFTSGNNINLSLQRIMWNMGEGIVSWENANHILFNNYFTNIDTLYYDGFDQMHQPSAFIYFIMVDNYFPGVITFSSGNESEQEIYVSDDLLGTGPIMISDNTWKDYNPVLFEGLSYSNSFDLLNVWQSDINDHSVLFISYIEIIISDINHHHFTKTQEILLRVNPNPFSEELTIHYQLPENGPALLEIYNLSGYRILQWHLPDNNNSEQFISWNPEHENANLTEGIYLVKLSQKEQSTTRKVIYSKQ